jgi:hypothetical protein
VIGEDDDAPITVTPRDSIYFPDVDEAPAIVSTITPAARGP